MIARKKSKDRQIRETKEGGIKRLIFNEDKNFKIIIVFLIFALAGFIIYSNTLQSPFIFDDEAHIPDNIHIRLTKLTFKGIIDAAFQSPAKNRPVANISFAINYYFHRYNVAGYHLTNIFIHILTGIFLYYLFLHTLLLPALRQKIKNPEWMSLTAAILWLVHPIQTQSVTYIVQRMNSMCAMFYILSMLLYVKGRLARIEHKRSRGLFGGCIFAGLLALGCKEIAATLPIFIFLYELYFFQNFNRAWLKRNAFYFAGAIFILGVIGILYLGPDIIEKVLAGYEKRDFTLMQRLLTQSRVLIFYLSLLFFPHPSRLNLDHHFNISLSLINPPTTILCIIAIFCLIVLAIVFARKAILVSFGIIWFFGNLLIESSILGLELVFEHRLFLPSTFLILAVTAAIWKLLSTNWLKASVFCIIIIILGTFTFQRNMAWGDAVSFWRDCAAKSPMKPRSNYNLATELYGAGNYIEAVNYYNKSLELDPNHYNAYVGLSFVYIAEVKLDEAIESCTKALELNPELARAYYNMGKAYYLKNNFEKATDYYQKALLLKRTMYQIYNDLGLIYYKQHLLDTAILYWQKCLKFDEEQPGVLNNLAWIMATHPDSKYRNESKSCEFAEKACRITNYEQPDLLETLAAAYASAGKFEKAIETAERAKKLAEAEGNQKLAQRINEQLELYKAGRPYREMSRTEEISNEEK